MASVQKPSSTRVLPSRPAKLTAAGEIAQTCSGFGAPNSMQPCIAASLPNYVLPDRACLAAHAAALPLPIGLSWRDAARCRK